MPAQSPWTDSTLKQLRSLIDQSLSARDIGIAMGGLTPKQITSKAAYLGWKLGRAPGGGTVRFWTPMKIALLREAVEAGMTVRQSAAHVGTTYGATQTMMARLQLKSKVRGGAPLFWTAERLTVLRELAAKGWSGSQIAVRIANGCSRSSVIIAAKRHGIELFGHRTRLNLPRVPRTGSEIAAMKRRQPQSRAGNASPHRPRPRPPANAGEPEPLGQIQTFGAFGECRWVHGDPLSGSWRMCCHPVHDRSSWCAHHWLRCYQPKGEA